MRAESGVCAQGCPACTLRHTAHHVGTRSAAQRTWRPTLYTSRTWGYPCCCGPGGAVCGGWDSRGSSPAAASKWALHEGCHAHSCINNAAPAWI